MAAERMLIALDGSRPAQSAAIVGLWLARALDSSVRLAYIVEPAEVEDPYSERGPEAAVGSRAGSPEQAVVMDEDFGQQVLDEIILAAESLDLDVVSEIDFGGVVPLLSRAAGECDMLALGRRGHDHAADEGALGTNFEQLLTQVERPLLIGGIEQPQSLDRVLLAYDGGEAAEQALGLVRRIKENLPKLQLDILAVEEHIADAGQAERWLQLARDAFSGQDPLPSVFTHHGDPGHEILAAAEEHHADLIVMGRGSRALPGITGRTLARVLRGGVKAVLTP